MDEQHARQLLTDERAKVEALLLNAEAGGRSDRADANERDGMSDGGERLTEQYTDDAVAAGMPRTPRGARSRRTATRSGDLRTVDPQRATHPRRATRGGPGRRAHARGSRAGRRARSMKIVLLGVRALCWPTVNVSTGRFRR